ncbi:MAG: hypothetical protein WCV69_04660 [Patescibacteria group bacterium]|jgi:hypothetical protein
MPLFIKIPALIVLLVLCVWFFHKGGKHLSAEDLEYVRSDGTPRPVSGAWDKEDDPPEAA